MNIVEEISKCLNLKNKVAVRHLGDRDDLSEDNIRNEIVDVIRNALEDYGYTTEGIYIVADASLMAWYESNGDDNELNSSIELHDISWIIQNNGKVK